MGDSSSMMESIAERIAAHAIHTVEVGAVDTYGHLRGKRVPAQRFLDDVARGGVNIADAIYVFDVQCEIVDSPLVNMGTGFLDMHLTPDLSSFRLLPHRPGYAIVLTDTFDEHGNPHPLDPAAPPAPSQPGRRARLPGHGCQRAGVLHVHDRSGSRSNRTSSTAH